MCFQVACTKCGKASWGGCGMHIDNALKGVPMQDRCKCKPCTQQEQSEQGSSGRPCANK
ncbi:hypothetical protein FOA52_010295 [Chlamydomonas sp. UWO 241]|nr:hypothetical protein FOA52_010295 [Chlamydomonas sp. UWO 241]